MFLSFFSPLFSLFLALMLETAEWESPPREQDSMIHTYIRACVCASHHPSMYHEIRPLGTGQKVRAPQPRAEGRGWGFP